MPGAMAQPNFAKVKEYRIERSVPPEAQACIECHKQTTPGVFADWANSRHANANITCLDCHLVQPGDQDMAKDHEKYYSRNDLPWGGSQVQGAHRHHRHAQGLLPLPSGRGDPVQQKQARQHHRDHVEAGPLAEQGHELGQRAQDRLLTTATAR
jgi:hypothetical protein